MKFKAHNTCVLAGKQQDFRLEALRAALMSASNNQRRLALAEWCKGCGMFTGNEPVCHCGRKQ